MTFVLSKSGFHLVSPRSDSNLSFLSVEVSLIVLAFGFMVEECKRLCLKLPPSILWVLVVPDEAVSEAQ